MKKKVKENFKPHLKELQRYQTSLNRDLEAGARLDRNEKVSNFPDEVMADVFRQFKNFSLSASPEAAFLYEKLASVLNIPKNRIYISCGITEGIRVLYETIGNPGDNVVVLDPTYPMYMIYAKFYQLDYRPFTYGKDCLPDTSTLYKNIDARTKFVVIPNPNLPVESVFTVDQIREILNHCRDRGIFVVIDEAYHFWGAPTVIDLVDEYDNLIVFRTFSKAYGLAGIRLGFMVSQQENIEYFSKTRSLVESNTLSMTIAHYFLDHPELRDKHIKEVKEGSQYLQKELTALGLKWYGGHVTNGILVFLKSKEEADHIVAYMRKQKIYIRGAFQEPYQACIRLSLGPKDIMARFINELKSWLAQETAVGSRK